MSLPKATATRADQPAKPPKPTKSTTRVAVRPRKQPRRVTSEPVLATEKNTDRFNTASDASPEPAKPTPLELSKDPLADLQRFLATELPAKFGPEQTAAFLTRRQAEPRDLLVLSRFAGGWVDATVSPVLEGWNNRLTGLAVRFYAGLPLEYLELAVGLLNDFGRRTDLAVTRQADLIRASAI